MADNEYSDAAMEEINQEIKKAMIESLTDMKRLRCGLIREFDDSTLLYGHIGDINAFVLRKNCVENQDHYTLKGKDVIAIYPELKDTDIIETIYNCSAPELRDKIHEGMKTVLTQCVVAPNDSDVWEDIHSVDE